MNKVIKDIWAHKTHLTRLPFIHVPAQRQKSDGNVYVCYGGVVYVY